MKIIVVTTIIGQEDVLEVVSNTTTLLKNKINIHCARVDIFYGFTFVDTAK